MEKIKAPQKKKSDKPLSRREALKLGGFSLSSLFLAACGLLQSSPVPPVPTATRTPAPALTPTEAPTTTTSPLEVSETEVALPENNLDEILDENLLDDLPDKEKNPIKFGTQLYEKMKMIAGDAFPRMQRIAPHMNDFTTSEQIEKYIQPVTNHIVVLYEDHDPEAPFIFQPGTTSNQPYDWRLEPEGKEGSLVYVYKNALENARGVDAVAWFMAASHDRKKINNGGFTHEAGMYGNIPEENVTQVGFTVSVYNNPQYTNIYLPSVGVSLTFADCIRANMNGDVVPPETLGTGISNVFSRLMHERGIPVSQIYSWYRNSQPEELMRALVPQQSGELDNNYVKRLAYSFNFLHRQLGRILTGTISPQDAVRQFFTTS